jgi:hypothetical protein
MVPGTQWANKMDHGLRAADVLIAVVSPDYVKSAFAVAEWQAKWRDDPDGRRRAVVPIVVRKAAVDGLLGGVTTIDLTEFADQGRDRDREVDARRRLLDGVGHAFRGRAKPTVPPGFPPRCGDAALGGNHPGASPPFPASGEPA